MPETPVNFSSLSGGVCGITPSAPMTRATSLTTSPCFSSRRELSFPSLVVVSHYVSRRNSLSICPSKQWVSRTREIDPKFPLTASIQAEFNSRAVVSVYQQRSVRRQRSLWHREESMSHYLQYSRIEGCLQKQKEKFFNFFSANTTLLIYV